MPFLTAMVLWFVLSLFFLFLVSVWKREPAASDAAGIERPGYGYADDNSPAGWIAHNFLYPLSIIVT